MNTNSKKAIASVAALQILLYHCWIPVFGYGTALGNIERFLVAATYSGVDAFFFISAFSLVSRPVEDYPAFIKNRAIKLLPLFFIALLLGQFLWFIPSIMLMYLVLPPLYKICSGRPYTSFILLISGWIGIVYLILGVIQPAQDFGIFLFRIPSILLGAYAVKIMPRIKKSIVPVAGILLLAVGTLLIYRYGYLHKLNTPFRGTFYLFGIPAMLGTVLLIDLAASNHNSRLISRFGSMTLELYFSQMVLGTPLVSFFFGLTGSRILTNIASLTVIIITSLIINKIYILVKK